MGGPPTTPDRWNQRTRTEQSGRVLWPLGKQAAIINGMLAAPIWHWWIGLIMLLAGVGATVGLLGSYLKQVTAQRYPGGRRGKEQEL